MKQVDENNLFSRELAQETTSYSPGNNLLKLYRGTLFDFPRLSNYEKPLTELMNTILSKLTNQTKNLSKLLRQVGVIIQYFEILRTEVERCPEVYPIQIGDVIRYQGKVNELKNRIHYLSRTGKKRKPTQKELKNGFGRISRDFESSLKEIKTKIEECETITCPKLYHRLYE